MKIKGSGLVALKSFVHEQLGEEACLKWLDNLTDDQRTVLEAPFASSWYDYRQMYTEPVRLMCEQFFPDRIFDGARALGTYAAEKQLTGIYRVLLKMGSPNMMISAAGKTWHMLHSAGVFNAVINEKGRAFIRAAEMPAFNSLIAQVTAAWMEKALEMSGGKEGRVVVHEKRESGEDFFEFELHWK